MKINRSETFYNTSSSDVNATFHGVSIAINHFLLFHSFPQKQKKKTTDDLSRTRVCLVEIVAHLNIKGCCNGAKWRNPFGIEMKVKWVFDVMLSVYLRAAFGNNKLR